MGRAIGPTNHTVIALLKSKRNHFQLSEFRQLSDFGSSAVADTAVASISVLYEEEIEKPKSKFVKDRLNRTSLTGSKFATFMQQKRDLDPRRKQDLDKMNPNKMRTPKFSEATAHSLGLPKGTDVLKTDADAMRDKSRSPGYGGTSRPLLGAGRSLMTAAGVTSNTKKMHGSSTGKDQIENDPTVSPTVSETTKF